MRYNRLAYEEPCRSAKPVVRKRRPNVRAAIKDAEKDGKKVTSVTLPDGTKLAFGEANNTAPDDPWERAMQGPKQ
jgi:hypothetical protein